MLRTALNVSGPARSPACWRWRSSAWSCPARSRRAGGFNETSWPPASAPGGRSARPYARWKARASSGHPQSQRIRAPLSWARSRDCMSCVPRLFGLAGHCWPTGPRQTTSRARRVIAEMEAARRGTRLQEATSAEPRLPRRHPGCLRQRHAGRREQGVREAHLTLFRARSLVQGADRIQPRAPRDGGGHSRARTGSGPTTRTGAT